MLSLSKHPTAAPMLRRAQHDQMSACTGEITSLEKMTICVGYRGLKPAASGVSMPRVLTRGVGHPILLRWPLVPSPPFGGEGLGPIRVAMKNRTVVCRGARLQ